MAAPIATSHNQTIGTGPTPIQLLGADPDNTDLAFVITVAPAHGVLTGLNTATGAVIYTPNSGFTGTDSFQFAVTSNAETSPAATVSLLVTTGYTRIVDSLPRPGTGPVLTGTVAFYLSQSADSTAGVIPSGAAVVANLQNGVFDVRLIPTASLNPQQYYQLWYRSADMVLAERLGTYEVPASNNILTLADCPRVHNSAKIAKFSFVSLAAMQALIGSLYQQLGFSLGVLSRTTNRLQRWTGATVGDSAVQDDADAVRVSKPFITTGFIESNELKTIAPNSSNVVWGVADETGDVALGVKGDGELVGAVSDTELKYFTPGADDFVWGVADQNGNVALGVKRSGEVYGLGGSNVSSGGGSAGQASFAFDGAGNGYFAKQLDGIWQIYKVVLATGVTTKLPFPDENFNPVVSAPYLYYARRLNSGAVQYRRYDLGTQTDALFLSNWVKAADYHHLGVTGQSLSRGYGAMPPLSLTQPYLNKKFNGGVAPGGSAGNLTSLVPLVEDAVETIASSMANALVHGNNEGQIIIASVHGENGLAYAAIKKGTTPYANGIAQFTAARNIVTALGKTYRVSAISLIHGETDHVNNNTNYAANLAELQADYQTDVNALTGQTGMLPLFLCQVSSWTQYGQATSVIPGAQRAAALANPGKVFLVGPKYFLTYPDKLHLDAASELWLGEYHAKAAQQVLAGGDWRPLDAVSTSRTGNLITVTFNVPVEPLVFDTVSVTDPNGKYGFEYADDSNSATLLSVAITGPNTVRLTLSATPTGVNKKVRYAWTGTPNAGAGPLSGPRGCLRDSDGTLSNSGRTLYNWCVHFEMAVT